MLRPKLELTGSRADQSLLGTSPPEPGLHRDWVQWSHPGNSGSLRGGQSRAEQPTVRSLVHSSVLAQAFTSGQTSGVPLALKSSVSLLIELNLPMVLPQAAMVCWRWHASIEDPLLAHLGIFSKCSPFFFTSSLRGGGTPFKNVTLNGTANDPAPPKRI